MLDLLRIKGAQGLVVELSQLLRLKALETLGRELIDLACRDVGDGCQWQRRDGISINVGKIA